MPIPSQNDFLLPFLNLLSDGQTLNRGQITYQLAQAMLGDGRMSVVE